MGNDALSPFGNALAGAFGGIISNALVYPLDTIKTHIQAETKALKKKEGTSGEEQEGVQSSLSKSNGSSSSSLSKSSSSSVSSRALMKHILKEYGVLGFYRGFTASMINTFSMQFAYFYWYSIVRTTWTKVLQRLGRSSKGPNNTAVELALGALAGALAQIFTIPVSVIATRQQLAGDGEHKSLFGTGVDVVKEDGVTGLWRGLKPSLVLTVNPAITYGAFERLKNVILGPTGKMTPWKAFMIGALSKTLATIVTYPYIMAKVRLQARYKLEDETEASVEKENDQEALTNQNGSSRSQPKRYNGALDVLAKTYKEKGITGWYQGMQAQITKAVLSQALLFGIKEELEEMTVILLAFIARLVASK